MIKRNITIIALILLVAMNACSGGSGKGNEKNTEQPAETQMATPEQANAGGSVALPENSPASTERNPEPSTGPGNSEPAGNEAKAAAVEVPVLLTKETFKKKVFDFEKNPQTWVYEGDLPCIIDFYADWCKPCKLVAPIMDELAKEYAGKVRIYKVDTDKERELSAMFGIRSIPSVLFCPMEGKPQMTQGALPKETFVQVINEFLLVKENQQ